MKTEKEIVDDLFGKRSQEFTYADMLKAMRLFAEQFRWIKTTCGKNIQFDDGDYEALRDHSLFLDTRTGQVLTVWVSEKGKRTVAPVAKLLLELEEKCTIHYKDKNLLNLRRNNIEASTHQVAHYKQRKPKTASGKKPTSKYKGVSWSKFAKKWAVSIKLDGIKKHLGYFIVEGEAAEAYNGAAKEAWGEEYSNLNILPNT